MAGTIRTSRQLVEVLTKGNLLPPYTYGTTNTSRQLIEILVSDNSALLPPYVYGSADMCRQFIEVLETEPYNDLDGSNIITFSQIAGDNISPATAITFKSPLISKSGIVKTLDGDIVNHGDFPTWSTNSLAWTQTRQAINMRAEANAICFNPVASTFGSLSADADKWFGGVLAVNGMIYGVPYSSTSILKIDPTTDTTTTFGSLAGTLKWAGGVLAPNGCIYCIPYDSVTILKIDPITDTATTFGSLDGTSKWRGGVLSASGMIYGIPFDSTAVLKIDPTTDTATTFGSLTGTSKWYGGALAFSGNIYGVPFDSTTVLKIDPTTDTATTFGSLLGTGKWAGGVVASNNAIFGMPRNFAQALKIDPATDTATMFGSLGSSAWPFYKTITISNTNVGSTLTDFPLCVKITADTDIGAACLASGDDIIFTDDIGNTYYTEVESFAVTAGSATGVFWVKVTISSSSTTVIYCRYGNPNAGSRTGTTSVWDSNFKEVYHLKNGTTLYATDSTSNASNGTIVNSIAAAGKIDGCAAFNGSNRYISIPRAISTAWTISFWMNATSNGAGSSGNQWYNGSGLVDGEVGGVTNDFGVSWLSNRVAFGIGNGDTTIQTGTLSLSTWYRVSCVRDTSTGKISIYINGALASGPTSAPTAARTTPANLAVGRIQTGGNYYNGLIDEIQISSIARSADWIKFDYYNQSAGEITWGGQVTTSAWSGGALAPDGMIYSAPHSSTATILKIDPTADIVSVFSDLSTSATEWTGCVLAPNGAIYGIPQNGTTVAKIGGPLDDVPTDFPLSRHFNKF